MARYPWDQYDLHLLPLVLEHPKLMLAESKQMTETLRKIYKAASDFIGDASLSAEQQVALKTSSKVLLLISTKFSCPLMDCWSVVYDSKLTRRKLMCASNCCLRTATVLSCCGRLSWRSVRRWSWCSMMADNLSNCARMRCVLMRWAAGVSNAGLEGV